MTLQRKTPLRGNPESHREWQRRSRERQIEAQRSGRRSGIKAKRKTTAERDAYIARVYGSKERLLAIKALPCAVPGCTRGPCDNAHTANGGMGRKADWVTIAPLCRWHHTDSPDSYHALGSADAFDRVHNTDLRALAARLAEELKP